MSISGSMNACATPARVTQNDIIRVMSIPIEF